MGFGEEDYSSKVPFVLHHINDTYHQHDITVDVNLDIQLMCCLSFSNAFVFAFSIVYFEGKSLCAPINFNWLYFIIKVCIFISITLAMVSVLVSLVVYEKSEIVEMIRVVA